MWPKTFQDRLQSWNRVRTIAKNQDLKTCLQTINQYWFHAPWSVYYLHWDDYLTWPDPWQLLNENIYCDLARGLGILYTIAFMEHKEIASAELVLTSEKHNLVLIESGKYILNWEPDQMLNKNLRTERTRKITLQDIQKRY